MSNSTFLSEISAVQVEIVHPKIFYVQESGFQMNIKHKLFKMPQV